MTPQMLDLCQLIDESVYLAQRSTEFPAAAATESLEALIDPLSIASETATVKELADALREYMKLGKPQ